jgi:hypothetical protein
MGYGNESNKPVTHNKPIISGFETLRKSRLLGDDDEVFGCLLGAKNFFTMSP